MNNYVIIGVDVTKQKDKYFYSFEDGFINFENIPKGFKMICGEYCDNIILGMPLTEFIHGYLESENYSQLELDRTFEIVKKKTGLEPFLWIGHVNN